jgi:SAM-dependent methyltransferase
VKRLYSFFPSPIKRKLRVARDFWQRISCYGTGRWCPVCGKPSRKFRPFGKYVPRKDAQCVHCGALERHRFVWLYLDAKTDLFDGRNKNLLHVAPERCFKKRFRERLGAGYVTADLLDPGVTVKMDVTDIPYPNGFFDAIYCSHVLEHVQNDRRAMREFYRVLKPDGWAILLVPITAPVTLEDSCVVEPNECLRIFGQEDHVRRYGPDYVERLRDAGFKVAVTKVSDLFKKEDQTLMGLTLASGEIYSCTKLSTLQLRPEEV